MKSPSIQGPTSSSESCVVISNGSFNDPFMNFDGKVSDKAWDEFIYKIPRYELASWEYDMKGWPSCCDDLMKCLVDDNGEYKFVCNHCSKEITMELD